MSANRTRARPNRQHGKTDCRTATALTSSVRIRAPSKERVCRAGGNARCRFEQWAADRTQGRHAYNCGLLDKMGISECTGDKRANTARQQRGHENRARMNGPEILCAEVATRTDRGAQAIASSQPSKLPKRLTLIHNQPLQRRGLPTVVASEPPRNPPEKPHLSFA